jgi:predicted nucleic acid-binding protein
MKWYSPAGESGLVQAIDILECISKNTIHPIVPDLLYYEVSNALACKTSILQDTAQSAVSALFALGMEATPIDLLTLSSSIRLAKQFRITVYDAAYAAIAAQQ